ncbi:hypothetical protein GJAV_G00008310 [Gymnothorax javanicus]|nr:hypothetical protein GJAV_G00008310 [Gymnothorax javanicus]
MVFSVPGLSTPPPCLLSGSGRHGMQCSVVRFSPNIALVPASLTLEKKKNYLLSGALRGAIPCFSPAKKFSHSDGPERTSNNFSATNGCLLEQLKMRVETDLNERASKAHWGLALKKVVSYMLYVLQMSSSLSVYTFH